MEALDQNNMNAAGAAPLDAQDEAGSHGQGQQASQASKKPANVVVLDDPISRGTMQITEVTVRTPKSGELRGVRLDDLLNGDIAALITVLPRVTMPTVLKEEAEAMTLVDLAQFAEVVVGFFVKRANRAKFESLR